MTRIIIVNGSNAYDADTGLLVAYINPVTGNPEAFVGGSGATRFIELTDRTAVDIPAINTPLATALAGKQATLVSGSNIKTVNGTSLLGSGDLVISGGSGSYPEALNFAALPGSPTEGDTYVVLQAQGVYFINRKPAGVYRYTSGAWAYLGEVPDGYFTDNVLRFFDNGDPTKQLAFELSGITTGTTRTLTVPDASGTIALTSQLTTDVPVGPFVAISADRTLTTADNNMVGDTGSTSRAITVLSGMAPTFIGCSIEGPCTWVAGGGVTLTEDRPTGKGYNYCQLVRVGTDKYRVLGART